MRIRPPNHGVAEESRLPGVLDAHMLQGNCWPWCCPSSALLREDEIPVEPSADSCGVVLVESLNLHAAFGAVGVDNARSLLRHLWLGGVPRGGTGDFRWGVTSDDVLSDTPILRRIPKHVNSGMFQTFKDIGRL